MAHMMKKVDFLNLAGGMSSVYFRTFRGSVYIRDGRDNTESEVEIYRASNMEEAGIISAMNQCAKYRKWMGQNEA